MLPHALARWSPVREWQGDDPPILVGETLPRPHSWRLRLELQGQSSFYGSILSLGLVNNFEN